MFRKIISKNLPGFGNLAGLACEMIFLTNYRMRRLTQVSLKPQARLLAGDILVFGRTARGEKITQGLIRDVWEVRRDERLLWTDALHLEGDLQKILNAPAGFNGCIAYATIIYAAENANEQLEWARNQLKAENNLYCAATGIGGLLVVRWLAHDALRLRKAYGAFWAAFRHPMAGLPSALPRLWYV